MINGDAIQADVSQGKPSDALDVEEQPQLSERDLALQEIADELSVDALETDQDDELQQLGGDDVNSTASDVLATSDQPTVLADDQLENTMVIVKVDGQDVELPLSEVTRGYQKGSTADRRLEAVAEDRKKLERERQEFETLQEKKVEQIVETPSTDVVDVDQQVATIMGALVEGDEETATIALKSVLEGRGQSSATPQQVDTDVVAQKAADIITENNKVIEQGKEQSKQWGEFVEANPAFADDTSKEREYGDMIFVNKYAPKIEAGELSYREALDATAEEISAVFGAQPAPLDPVPEVDPEISARDQRLARKKKIDNLPTASTRAAAPVVQQESTEDVLTEMRKNRGQVT